MPSFVHVLQQALSGAKVPRMSDIGPGAPWFEEDGPEYVGDDVLYNELLEDVAKQLRNHLEARLERLSTREGLMVEIRDQMTVASAQGHFGEVRELHDLMLALLLAAEATKRAV